jgi:hypothetical protein
LDLPEGRSVAIDWDRLRVFDKEVAQMFVNMIKSSDSARFVGTSSNCAFKLKFRLSRFFQSMIGMVTLSLVYLSHFIITLWIFFRVLKVTQDTKSKSKPQALNTIEMLRAASSGLGMLLRPSQLN